MAPEGTGGGEFAQLVTYHILGDVHGDMLLSVMYGNGVTDHIGEDGGRPGPSLDDGLLAGVVHFLDPGKKPFADKRAFLN